VRKFINLLLLAIGFCATLPCFSDQMQVARRGMPAGFTIVTGENPPPSVKFAASELRDYVKKITDVELPVAERVAGGRKSVRLTIDEKLGDDGFRLKVENDGLCVSGGKRGVLYGVYELLERFGGVGWFSSWCEVVPERDTFAVPSSLDETHKPKFLMREAYWYDAYVYGRGDFAARLRLNGNAHPLKERHGGKAFRFGGGLGNCHTFDKLVPPKKFFADHPQWYCERGGKRKGSGNWQLCLTNPEMTAQVVSNVLAAVKRDPAAKCYGVSQNDNRDFCECTECKAVDDAEGSHAGTMIRFVNAVAEAVEKKYPDKIIETLAYQYTQKPPRTVRPRDNVMPCLCSIGCDFAEPISTGVTAANLKFKNDIAGWAAISKQLYIWDYAASYSEYLMPFPVEAVLQDNIRFFAESGAIALFELGNYQGQHGDLAELKTYLTAKLLWNPDADVRALEKTFTDGYYGAAAPFVREYLALRRALVDSPRNWSGKFGCFARSKSPLFTDEFVNESVRLWVKARKAVKGDAEREYNVRMSALSSHYLKAVRDGRTVNVAVKVSALETARSAACAKEALAAIGAAKKSGRHMVYAENKDNSNTVRRRLQAVAALADKSGEEMPEGRGIAEENVLTFLYEGKMMELVDDETAGNGRALKLKNNDSGGWYTQLPLSEVAFDEGVKYRLRIRVRAKKIGEAAGKGFGAGVYDPVRKKGVKYTYYDLKDLSGDYAWYEILDWKPEKTQYIWIAPGMFDKKKYKHHPGHEGIFVDALEISRCAQ
jgi:hypothetical protein